MNEERMRQLAEAMSGANDDTSEGTFSGVLKESKPNRGEGLPVLRFNNPFDTEALEQRSAERLLAGYPDFRAPIIESPLFDAAFAQYATGGTSLELTRQRALSGEDFVSVVKDDNQWAPSAKEIKEVADKYKLPEAWFNRLGEARSPEDLERVAQVGAHRTARQADLRDSRGLAAEATKFVAAASDPVFMVAGFGAGTIAKVGQASTRFGNALRASGAAVAVDSPLETFRVYNDPDATQFEAAIAVMASGILSGALGGAFGRHMSANEIKEMEEQLSSLVEQRFDSSVGAKQLNPIFRELEDGTVEPINTPERQQPRWSSPSTWFAWGVPVQKMQQSSSPAVRKLASVLTWNPQIKGNQGTTAYEVARRITEGTSSFARPYKQAEKAFFKEAVDSNGNQKDATSVFGGTNTEQRREFGKIVWRHVNGVAKSEDPNVLKAADALSNMQLEALAYAQSRAYSGGDAKLAKEINNRVHQRLQQEAKAAESPEVTPEAVTSKKNPYFGRKSFRGAEDNRGPKPSDEAPRRTEQDLNGLTKAQIAEAFEEEFGYPINAPIKTTKKADLVHMYIGEYADRKRTAAVIKHSQEADFFGSTASAGKVEKAADEIAEQLIEYDGFDAVKNLVHSPDYLPRRFSVDGIQNYRKTRTDDDIISNLAAAISRANPERFGDNAKKAKTVAKHYWETVLDVYIRQDDGPRFAKKTFQDRAAARDEVLKVLEEQGKKPDDIAEEAMDLLIEQLAPLQRAVSESNRAKPRMKLDLNSEWSKGLDEIFEQDALDLALDYSRTMAGYAALNRAGFNSIAELNKMISQAAKELDKDVDLKATADTLDELRFWRDSILGQPSEELAKSPKVSWLASQARRVNFAAYMSNVAFAAVSEIAGHAMRVGVFNYMDQFSRYRGYMKRARKGDRSMADDIFATADIVMGHGTGMLRAELAQRTQRYDFDFPETDPGFNRGRDVAERIDTGTRKAANAVSRLSAMAPLQQFMRMTYVSAMADHLVKKAAKGGLPFSKRRMETMGITEEMWGRISAELNNSGKVRSPDTNREVSMIRHQDWKDREAADAFINWIDRDSRRMILEGDVGHSPRFLREKPMLALMFQFLSFPINAWTKHSGYLGSVKDGRAFAEMLVMATGGMIGVQARTFLQGSAIEDEERRAKFFEDRLNPLEMAKSSFYYSAHASLIPNIYDTAIGTARSFVGEEVLPNELSFSYTRNSGLASSFLTGNPTVATIDRAAKVLPSFFDEDGATKQDVQKAIKLLPFGNHVASIAVSEHLLSMLPEEDVN